MASVKYIARMSEERRLAVLTAFVKAQEVSALDEAVDVLDMLILDITRSAKNNGQKKRLRTLKDLDRAALLLARACALCSIAAGHFSPYTEGPAGRVCW